MEKKKIKTLKEKLSDAIKIVLVDNKSELDPGTAKAIRKSVKRIVKKAGKKILKPIKKNKKIKK